MIRFVDKRSFLFKNSLEILMKRMSQAKPIFIRCIKPNSSKKPNDFNDKYVLLQVNKQLTNTSHKL